MNNNNTPTLTFAGTIRQQTGVLLEQLPWGQFDRADWIPTYVQEFPLYDEGWFMFFEQYYNRQITWPLLDDAIVEYYLAYIDSLEQED